MSTVNSDGSVTTTTLSNTSGGPGAKAPVFSNPNTPGLPYWDVLSIAGTSTNYYNQVPYITAPPNPSIATGPDDILLVVNRTISRYPNPNAAGNSGPTNPYDYLATEFTTLDVWLGLAILGGNNSATALCPSGTGSNSTCVIDNASIRYDQLIGRFVVLFTVTDVPAHRSNWVLITSNFAQFRSCASNPGQCPGGSIGVPPGASSPFFTTPVIAPVVGGTSTGGVNTANWTIYTIPINLQYNTFQQPSALGLINNPLAVPPFNNPLANSAVGTLNNISTGGATGTSAIPFLTVPFCTNGGPSLPLTYATVNGQPLGAGGTGRTCTNYFPTGARLGIDNDNIILTSPVLDQAFSPNEGNFPALGTPGQGPYAGTRVTTVPKMQVYNFSPNSVVVANQPPACLPATCGAVNLADDAATGTLTAITTKIAFGQGIMAVPPTPAGDLQYGVSKAVGPPGANPILANSCFTSNPVAVVPTPITAVPPAVNNPSQAVLSCAPLVVAAVVGVTPANTVTLPAIFWEPDNLRGRALASFDSQVASFGSAAIQSVFAGVITPIDYLVGTEITDNFGQGVKPQGTAGVTGQVSPLFGTTLNAQFPATAGIGTIYYLKPIVFSCPTGALLPGLTGVDFCGTGVNGTQSQIPDLPVFSSALFNGLSTLAQVADPAPVGQGWTAGTMTTSQLNTPVSSTVNSRIFVGDSRPEQVMFREGLLYVARSVRLGDLANPTNWLGTSTVLYDIIKTCAQTASQNPTCTGGYNAQTGGLTTPNLAFEYEWFNGTTIPDPNGDINGFGFYQPMFELPADVVTTGPVAPISTLQLFDKLFVGMTTGGTSNTAATFSHDFPSLWDFRPGDDAFDSIQPYLDPYTGTVRTQYVCGGDVSVTVLSGKGSTTITVDNSTGLGVGMFLSGSTTTPPQQITGINGTQVTLNVAFAATTPTGATFTRTQPSITVLANLVTAGSNQITVASNTGLAIGQTIGSTTTTTTAFTGGEPPPALTTTYPILSATNVGVGMTIAGNSKTSVTVTLTQGSKIFTVPNGTPIAFGEVISGTGLFAAGTKVDTVANNGLVLNPDLSPTIVVTATNPALQSGSFSVTLDDTACFTGFVQNVGNQPTVTSTVAPTCNSFVALAANHTQLNGITINNGIPVTFASAGFFPAGTTIINIVGNVLTLSNVATIPGAGGQATTNIVPFAFTSPSASATCPIIPFSARGGASTDPNDGSLWLFGEFAKNRLSTIPGPGQWGTSVANYALSFPALDSYGNDNTYFQDVQPTGSADSAYFTWIQLAKNLGLAVPSSLAAPLATGGCTLNGVTPIQQPPSSGTPPNPGTSVLSCPNFGPESLVTRAEMAYWIVRAQMDENQVSNYLCATGGDPTGTSPGCGSAGNPGFTFADSFTVASPFLQPSPSNALLGIQGVTAAQIERYIEVMARRGYTKGCSTTSTLQTNFCPTANVTRAEMAAFIIRAKLNNVYPTVLSGTITNPYGDAFTNFVPLQAYFSDVTQSATDPAAPFFNYIQKLRELRITNGTGGALFTPGSNLTRKEIAVFIVRAFFL